MGTTTTTPSNPADVDCGCTTAADVPASLLGTTGGVDVDTGRDGAAADAVATNPQSAAVAAAPSRPLKLYQGQTPDPRQATRDAVAVRRTGLLPIVEIFYSLQGEGSRTGQATVFVRVAGCTLACSFCDTDFRVRRALSVDEVVDEVAAYRCPWVCLTGGEPTMYDLQPLCDALHARGLRIQVETNGQHPRPSWGLDHITVSPKETEGGRLDPWYLEHATEFKIVVDGPDDVRRAISYPGAGEPGGPLLFLQPNALNPDAARLCIEAVQAHPDRLRLSLQTHKILEIR